MEIVRDLKEVGSAEQVVPVFLRLIGERANGAHIYRGQRRAKWPLRAYLLRDPDNEGKALSACDAANIEYQLLQGFSKYLFAHRPDLFSASHGDASSEWRKMAIAQHYGVPTRFIDFCTNPLVALYFAVQDDPQAKGRQRSHSAVWAVEAKNRREVDKVGTHITEGVADLPPLDLTFVGLVFDALEETKGEEGKKQWEFRWPKGREYDLIRKHVEALRTLYEIPPKGENDRLFKPLSVRLVKQFKKKEEDGAVRDCRPDQLTKRMVEKCVNTAFVPEDMDGRISAHTSVFMYEPSRLRKPSYTLEKALEAVETTFQVIIPARLRDRIRVELNELGINRASLFPDLQGAGKHLKWMISDQKRLDNLGRLGGDVKKMVYGSERWERAHKRK